MLMITLSDKSPDLYDPTREFYGWLPGESVAENWAANRGHWTIDRDAHGERFVIFAHRGRYVMAAEIDGVNESPYVAGKRVLSGRPLDAGHPIYDLFVGHPAPRAAMGAQNPIRYLSEADVAEIILSARMPVG